MKILDLSENKLTGTIPDFLGELKSLRLLNLSGNQFTGSIPPVLLSRSTNGKITLSIEGNPGLCDSEDSCKKKNSTAIIAVSVVLAVVALMVVLAFIVWKMGRQGFNSGSTTVVLQTEGYPGQLMNNEKVPLQAESWQFTYAELEKITKNFQRQIGKGGFGTVYHGYLDNGTQVAVKLHSQSSSQGSNELMTEGKQPLLEFYAGKSGYVLLLKQHKDWSTCTMDAGHQ